MIIQSIQTKFVSFVAILKFLTQKFARLPLSMASLIKIVWRDVIPVWMDTPQILKKFAGSVEKGFFRPPWKYATQLLARNAIQIASLAKNHILRWTANVRIVATERFNQDLKFAIFKEILPALLVNAGSILWIRTTNANFVEMAR